MLNPRLVLQAETTLRLTPEGRIIERDDLLIRLQQFSQKVDLTNVRFMECLNCGFILDELAFAQGCPNCGCKDVDFYQTDKLVSKASTGLPGGICWWCKSTKDNVYGLCSGCGRFGKGDQGHTMSNGLPIHVYDKTGFCSVCGLKNPEVV